MDELVKRLREPRQYENCILCQQAADVIEELMRRCEQFQYMPLPRWIPVTERLPEKMQYVLVRYQNNDMAVASWFGGDEHIRFWRAMTDDGWCADCDTEPTHWMPLPSTEGLNEA